MFSARKTAVLFSAALLVACEPVSEPEVAPTAPNFQRRGAVASSVTGSGHFLNPAGLRVSFSFTALEIGGLVDGEFNVNIATGGRAHGIITCFLIVGAGNEARIGGRLTRTASGPIAGVAERVFRVIDNRPPRTNNPDQLSFLFRPGRGILANVADAGAFCDPNGTPPDLPLQDIVSGNIMVFDNPPNAPN